MENQIIKAQLQDAQLIATLISEANKPIASKFGITFENNPKHPSFYTTQWVLSDLEKGEQYFIIKVENLAVACVAYESPNEHTAYLNRLAVLPTYQKKGLGELLVKHIIAFARMHNKNRISIGTIAEYAELTHWYEKLGFIKGATKVFNHLPFNVLFMTYKLGNKE